jgi:cellulose biosynthesis protein BcsQ
MHAKTVVTHLRKELAQLNGQLNQVMEQEGRFWETTPGSSLPAFRPLVAGRPPIVALVNLKGGVGKTTLTANLGATLWSRGARTLLVDLDNQGSLTALCLPPQEMQDLRKGRGNYIHHLLKPTSSPGALAWDLRTRIGDTPGYLLAAGEELADLEEHAKAAWLMQPDCRDVRYDLRAALHDPLVQDNFDVILLDCPPRLSTACINALTCCDFVVVPVLVDKLSAANAPRLLKWLRLLKSRNVCPDLAVLGILANATHNKNRLTMKEKDLLSELESKCQDAWQEPVAIFERFIPKTVHFADAASGSRFAALDDDLRPLFLDLANELQQRAPIHARGRVAKVHR